MPGLLEPPRELRLGAPHEALAAELLVDTVGDRGRATQRVELAGLLDRAQGLDEPGRRHELDAAGAERVGVGERDVPRLDGDPAAREPLRQRRDDVPWRLLERHVRNRARGVRVAEVRVERRVARGIDEQCGIGALEPREVPHVDEPGDEQRVVQRRCEALDPIHASLRSASSSSARR